MKRIVLTLSLVCCITVAWSSEDTPRLTCKQIQEKVNKLNSIYGSYEKAPKKTREELDSLIKSQGCTIIGNSRDIMGTKFSISGNS